MQCEDDGKVSRVGKGPALQDADPNILGRPLGYLIFSLMALIGDPIYYYFFKGF